MADTDDTPLQAEIRSLHLRELREMEAALGDIPGHHIRARLQCREAYYRRIDLLQDEISQRHGLPGKLHRMVA